MKKYLTWRNLYLLVLGLLVIWLLFSLVNRGITAGVKGYYESHKVELTGAKGEKGDKGDIGLQGFAGKDGIDGKNGKDGVNGLVGANGQTGVSGENGLDGKDGVNGVDGKDACTEFVLVEEIHAVAGHWHDSEGHNTGRDHAHTGDVWVPAVVGVPEYWTCKIVLR